MRRIFVLSILLILVSLSGVANVAYARHQDDAVASSTGPSNATILIVRHAEKPADGDGLTPQGEAHAQWYVQYFENYKLDGQPVHFDMLFAAADSTSSMRPRLTITPLSEALKMPIDTDFKNKHYQDMVNALQTQAAGKTVLICWHHEEIANLLTALGADPNQLIPGDVWPEDQYSWVIQLCYDKDGHLIPSKTKRIVENWPIK